MGTECLERLLVDRDRVDVTEEVVDPEGAAEACAPVGRQHVVRAGQVVAEACRRQRCRGRPLPHSRSIRGALRRRRPGAPSARARPRSATAHASAGPSTSATIPPSASVASRSSRREDSATRRVTSALTAVATSSDQVTSQASPSGPCSACTTRSTAASSAGVSGPAITTTSEGPANPRGNPDHVGHLALGLGDVAVAWTDDHVDRPDRLGAVGHGRDGLGATDPVDLVDPGDPGGRQCRVVDPAVGGRGGAEHDLPDAGDPSGSRAHQHRRGVARPSPRRVAAGASDRPGEVPHRDPACRELLHLGGRLMRVVGTDPIVRDLEGVS